jgi:hypothetical protein
VRNFTHHAYRHHFFFVIAANAPRRALGRASATFFVADRRAAYVDSAKRAIFTKIRQIASYFKLIRAFRFEKAHVTSRHKNGVLGGGVGYRNDKKEPFAA